MHFKYKKFNSTRASSRCGAGFALLAAASLAASLAGGCARLLGDGRPADRAATMSGGELQECLARLPGAFERYFREEPGADRGVDESFECVDRALALFEAKARFARQGVWELDEVRRFVETYLRGGRPLQSEALAHAFRVKQAAFGGSATEATSDDLDRVRALLSRARAQAKRLAPFALIYSGQAELEESPHAHGRLDAAIDSLAQAARDLALTFGGPGRAPANIRSAIELIAEAKPEWPVRRYAGLIEAGKALLIGPPAETVAPAEWPDAVEAGARAFGESLRYRYFLKDLDFFDPRAVAPLEATVRNAFAALRRAIARRGPSDSVRVEEWSRLVAAFGAQRALPGGVSVEAAQAALKPLFEKLLRHPGAPGRLDRAPGLGPAQLERAEDVFTDWLRGHRLALQAPESPGLPTEALRSAAAWRRLAARALGGAPGEEVVSGREPPSRTAADFGTLFLFGRPLAWLGSRLAIALQAPGQGRADLIVTNGVRWAARWALESYASDRARAIAAGGLSETEAQALYLDARPIGVDLGFMDPRVRNAGSRSFLEATLFTSASRGGDLISFREASEFFAMLLSGGRTARDIYDAAVLACPWGRPDAFGDATVDAKCFRSSVRKGFAVFFGHLPGMAAEMARASDSKWDLLFEALEHASRPGGPSSEPVEAAEIKVMASVLQYAESLTLRFDVSPRDGSLSEEEIWSAFPIFRRFIARLAQESGVPFEWEWLLRAIFSYLPRHGGPPPPGKLRTMAAIGVWQFERQASSFDANRVGVVQIIASLARFGRQKRIREIEDWVDGFAGQARTLAFAEAAASALAESGEKAALRVAELFGCPDFLAEPLQNLTRARSSEILFTTPEGVSDADEFGRNLSRLIRADSALGQACSPPY